MILFESDWDRYPSANIHVNTQNETWKHIAIIYRDEMYIKNWRWPLAIIDQKLQYVNPHDPFLSEEMKIRVVNECSINPWYALREVVLVPQKGSVPLPCKADRGNLMFWWLFFNHIETTNIQLRQTGKTIKLRALVVILLTMMCINYEVRLGTQNEKKKKDEIDSIKEMMSCLPPYIYSKTKDDADNYEYITNAVRKNKLQFSIGSNNEINAKKAGIGFTTPAMFIDEVAETDGIDHILQGAIGSMGAAIEIAKKANIPWGIGYFSTAGSTDTRSGATYCALATSAAPMTEKYYDCANEEELIKMIGTNSKLNEEGKPTIRVNVALSYRQLGISDEEFQSRLSRVPPGPNREDIILRHYYSLHTQGSKSSPLTKPQLRTLRNTPKKVFKTTVSPEGYIENWFKSDEELNEVLTNGYLILGNDTSNISGSDDCALTITDIRDGSLIMRTDVNVSLIPTYATYIARLLIKYKKSILVIENKSTGQSILDTLFLLLHDAGEDPFKRIYNDYYQNPHDHKLDIIDIESTTLSNRDDIWYAAYKKHFGFKTDQKLRKELYEDVLYAFFSMAGRFISDDTLATQMRLLERTKTGRVDHPVGGHDDAVISWLLCGWFILNARNVSKYGISPRLPQSLATRTDDGDIDTENLEFQKIRNAVQTTLLELEKKYEEVDTNSISIAFIEERIIACHGVLQELGVEAVNVDQVIADLREKKRGLK